MPNKSNSTHPIALALHGGGAHAALAWGMMDALALDRCIAIAAVTATGAGALQACVLAQGLMDGDADYAADLLKTFWQKVSTAASMLPFHAIPVDKYLGSVGLEFASPHLMLDAMTKLFSPYQFNLLDFNPMRSIVEEMIDFPRLAKHAPFPLFLNATHVTTGVRKVFTGSEISLDAVMACACVPYLFKTALVKGEPYWEGSYTGSPALSPLLEVKDVWDAVILQTLPVGVEEVPMRATDILERTHEISHAAVLQQEIAWLERRNERLGAKEQPLYVHLIEAGEVLNSLGRSTRLKADWDFLTYLHDAGMQAAQDWLKSHAGKLGKVSTAA